MSVINVHILDPEYAYDQTQCREGIDSGDTLVAGDVVGFMLDAWPVAVTEEAGQFHSAKEEKDPEGLYDGSDMKPCAIANAVRFARSRGLKLQPVYDEYY